MGFKKDITSRKKQDFVKLLSDRNTTLEIVETFGQSKEKWKTMARQEEKWF